MINDFFIIISNPDENKQSYDSFSINQNKNKVYFSSNLPFTPFFYKLDKENRRLLISSDVNYLEDEYYDSNKYNADFFSFDEHLNYNITTLNDSSTFLGHPFFEYYFDLDTLELSKKLKENFAINQFIEDFESSKQMLKETLIKIFKKYYVENPVILFSGGVDSSFIALMLKHLNPELITLGIKGLQNHDYHEAEKVANFLGLKLNYLEVELEDVEKAIPEVIKIIGSYETVKVEVGLVSYLLYKNGNIKQRNVFAGLGSEELFAGYERHISNPFVECFSGTFNIFHRDYYRDYAIAKHFKNKAYLPLLDEELIPVALAIKNFKIYDEHKKYILRVVASELGLKDYAFRKKLAAQYGSSISKAVEKIAKKNGFRYKRDYLKSIV
ncbi:MAG: asparagine synthase-related protein [Candidatus Woesearchaeota archaeon]